MDIATHALTSVALARGLFPRRGRAIFFGVLVAGTLADIDLISTPFGPAATFAGRHTFTHSILGTALVISIALALTFLWSGKKKELLGGILAATSLAAVVHVLMDLCAPDGVALAWPLSPARIAADWIPGIDTWILTLLIVGIVVPEIFGLVSSEIGARDKTPRGKNGALIALALTVAYIGTRGLLHGSATSMLEAHYYRGESPRRVGAFAGSLSMLTWRGVVETQSNVCLLAVPVAGGAKFDPEAAVCMHKPEDSAALEAAGKTKVGSAFVRAAQFPRASVEKTDWGFEVVIRDVRDMAEEEMLHRVAATVSLDEAARVQSQNFVWAQDVRLR